MTAAEFAARVRAREIVVGYWSVLDNPVGAERLARAGYDYVALDAQHGLLGYSGVLAGLTAIDAAGGAVGLVRVEANNATPIGKALDAGAAGVIVPLVDTVEDVVVHALSETPQGLANGEEIAATPGLDGLYVGPSDLTLAVGGATPADPSVADVFAEALIRVRKACEAAGIAA